MDIDTKMSRLIDRVIERLESRRQKLLNGGINSIPSPFQRFSEDFLGIEQGKYYLVTSSTKGAKTQFTSYVFVYHTLMYAFNHPDKVRVKIFYYPLEETPEDILERFMSYLLYFKTNGNTRVSPTDLKSSRNSKPVDKCVLDVFETEEYKAIIEFFEENVIFSRSSNPTGMYNECRRYAEEHGKVHTKTQRVKDELTGVTKEIQVFDWYEPDDKDEYRIILWDHVSLASSERGMSLKQTTDKLSEYAVILRDRYIFSPVFIQQQAFAGESLDAFKENKLRPTLANLSDTKYTSRDANVVLGLFSPFKHELEEYLKYDISVLRDNVRFLEVLVNRGGSPGGIVALYFDGAVNFFKELPLPDTMELHKVYEFLKRRRSSATFMMFTEIRKVKNKLHRLDCLPNFAGVINKLKRKCK